MYLSTTVTALIRGNDKMFPATDKVAFYHTGERVNWKGNEGDHALQIRRGRLFLSVPGCAQEKDGAPTANRTRV